MVSTGANIFIHVLAIVIILIIIGIAVYFIWVYYDLSEDTQKACGTALNNISKLTDVPIPIRAFIDEFSKSPNFSRASVLLTYDASGKTLLTKSGTDVIQAPNKMGSFDQNWRIKLVSNNLVISDSNEQLFWTTPATISQGGLITLTSSNSSQYQIDSRVNNISYITPSQNSNFALTASNLTGNTPAVKLSLQDLNNDQCLQNPLTLYAFGFLPENVESELCTFIQAAI